MTWFDVMKLDNVDIARIVLEGPPTDNTPENYDPCCELAREAAEVQLREYGDIGDNVIGSSEWKNYNCTNLRKELEMFADMGFPGMIQIVEAWDKCAEMGGADDLV